jgi:hypothetical protein
MGSQYPGNYRSDEQLDASVLETAAWTVNVRNGQVLCRAADTATSGAGAVSFCRRSADSITVFDAQIARLRKQCAGREVAGSAFL